MAATVASIVALNFSLVSYRKTTSWETGGGGGLMKAARKVSASRPMEHTATNISYSSSSAANYNLDEHENNINRRRRLNLKEFIEQTKDLITSTNNDRGPPRWFSPLESGNRWKDSPLLLYLPGLDGVGLGLISHYHTLGKVFDIRCLHIPVKDRTPFKDLVQLVDRTVKEENRHLPNRPIYLVGESIGGCLALAVAARNPTLDLMLILANPATSYRKSQLRNLVPFLEAIPEPLHIVFPYILATFTGDPLKMAMASGQRALPFPQTIQELSENLSTLLSSISVVADAFPRESLLWKLKLLESASSFANSCIHAVKAQTLILASGRDQLLPSLEEADRLSDVLPACKKRYFKNSGHTLFMEDGFDLVTVIKGAGFYRRTRKFDHVTDFIPPTPCEFKHASESFRWLDIAASPVMLSTLENGEIVRGLAGIPSDGPVILVGYHMLMELERRLPDSSAFDELKIMGAVPVSASNLKKLLGTKSHVLLFPGGFREAFHRKGEENKLFWPSQSEFVRVAAKFGAKIVPFGSVGTDDLMDVVLDYDDQMRIPFVKTLIEYLNAIVPKLRTDAKGEVANQVVYVPGVLPKPPGRFYFLFGKPIETEGRKNELRDKEKAHELYMHVKSEVEKSMNYLKEKREKDPYRSLLPRLIYQANNGLTSEIPTFDL